MLTWSVRIADAPFLPSVKPRYSSERQLWVVPEQDYESNDQICLISIVIIFQVLNISHHFLSTSILFSAPHIRIHFLHISTPSQIGIRNC